MTAQSLVDPTQGTYIFDDFVMPDDLVTDNNVGQVGWQFTAIGNGGTFSYPTATGNGILRHVTAVTADGDGTALHGFPDQLVLTGGHPGYFQARVRYPEITGNVIAGNNFRIGLEDSVDATAPTVGIWVLSDSGVLSLEADSADHVDRAKAVAGVSTLTSGTTMVLGTWHDIKVVWGDTNAQGGPKTVRLYVDGELGAEILDCQIDNDEEVELKPLVHWQDSGSGDTLEVDADYVAFFLPRL